MGLALYPPCSLPLLANLARSAPRRYWTHDPRPGLCSPNSISVGSSRHQGRRGAPGYQVSASVRYIVHANISVSAFRQAELREAIEDAPIYQFLHMAMHQLLGWPLYLIRNASGQLGYPAYTNRKLLSLQCLDQANIQTTTPVPTSSETPRPPRSSSPTSESVP